MSAGAKAAGAAAVASARGFAGGLWRALLPLRRAAAHVSPLGGLIVATMVGALLAGRRYGWDELVVLGCALAGVLVFAVLLTFGRSTYAVDLDLADHRVVVGQRALGRIAVTNVGRGRLLPAQIELPVGAGSANFDLPSMAAGAVHEEVFAVPTARRAIVTVGPVLSVRGDALGLVRRQVRWTNPEQLYIHPLTVSLASARTGVMRDLEGEATRVLSENDMSFHALREYVPGDDRRNIHWRTSARIGQLMVRQFEDTRRTHTALALADRAEDYRDEDEFEFAVSIYASLGVQVIRDGLEVTAMCGPRVLRSQTPPRLLDDCAGLEIAAPGTGDGQTLAQHVARQVPHASMALIVTGGAAGPQDLRASAIHIPAGVRTIFLACSPGAELGLQTSGMLSTATIGRGQDLPRLVSRLVTG